MRNLFNILFGLVLILPILPNFFVSCELSDTDLSFIKLTMAAYQGLTEAEEVRDARLSTATWGYSYLEDSGNNYIWQPETLQFADSTTGNESWRIAYQPTEQNPAVGIRGPYIHDIGWPQFSGNGKYVAFLAPRQTGAFNYGPNTHWYTKGIWLVERLDGSYLRPMPDSPARGGVVWGYYIWSPALPNVAYAAGQDGWTAVGENNLSDNNLYSITVSDTSDTIAAILTDLPEPTGGWWAKKSISGDGNRLLLKGGRNVDSLSVWVPLTLSPSDAHASATTDDDGYSRNRDIDSYWGPNDLNTTTIHDEFAGGTIAAGNIRLYYLPETADALGEVLALDFDGTDADGGAINNVDNSSPYNWGGEFEYVQTHSTQSPSEGDCVEGSRDPWCCDNDGGTTECTHYFSHYTVDRWGNKIVATNSSVGSGTPSIFNIPSTHTYAIESYTDPILFNTHNDYSAFSDWWVSSNRSTDAGQMNIRKFDTDDTDIVIGYSQTKQNAGASGGYNSITRPTQSPDGTKVMYHSTIFHETNNYHDLFYVVAYYPYPPEIESVTATGGAVTVTVYWDLDGNNRGYTTRGWPIEGTDDPPPPREIEKFVLWRSEDKVTWAVVDTSSYTIWDLYDFVDGTWDANNEDHADNKWTLTDTGSVSTTYYYAITSREWSGLESKSLSNIFSIALDGSGDGNGAEDTGYPATPGADADFYSTAQNDPVNVALTHEGGSRYTITWSEPANPTYIRYYNIYALDGSAPTAIQQRRILSIAATQDEADGSDDGVFSIIDPFGDTGGATQYGITSVSFQGDESTIFPATGTIRGIKIK